MVTLLLLFYANWLIFSRQLFSIGGNINVVITILPIYSHNMYRNMYCDLPKILQYILQLIKKTYRCSFSKYITAELSVVILDFSVLFKKKQHYG